VQSTLNIWSLVAAVQVDHLHRRTPVPVVVVPVVYSPTLVEPFFRCLLVVTQSLLVWVVHQSLRTLQLQAVTVVLQHLLTAQPLWLKR
jgi:hypothetical protein